MPGAATAELFAESFDFVWIDLEHAPLSTRDAQEMMVGAQATGAQALVRLDCGSHTSLIQSLDAGADGIVLADVSDADALAQIAASMKHPPQGTRGWGPRRLASRNRNHGETVSSPALWAQIESVEGVAHASEIATIDGVDALIVGAGDLSLSLGEPLDYSSDGLRKAIATVESACRASGKIFGLAGVLTATPLALRDGASVLIHNTDARIARFAADAEVSRIRQES